MQIPALQQSLGLYQQWKTRLAQALLELERWLAEHRRATPRARERLKATLDVIRRDRLTVAVVGEPARGKAELINAIFFPDVGGRLLPPTGGAETIAPRSSCGTTSATRPMCGCSRWRAGPRTPPSPT
jgi:hypothetical protein